MLGIGEARKAVGPRFFATRVLPVGLLTALALHTGNLTYLYLTVAFIQMLKVASTGHVVQLGRKGPPCLTLSTPARPPARPTPARGLQSLTPIVTMLALFAARLARPSRPLTLSVIFIALGTALASAGEVNLDAFGVTIHMVSMVAEAVRLVMTQLLLSQQRFHPSE